MASVPPCDIDAAHGPAYADAKLSIGPWAYVCRPCFDQYHCRLGLGCGQELVTSDKPDPPRLLRRVYLQDELNEVRKSDRT